MPVVSVLGCDSNLCYAGAERWKYPRIAVTYDSASWFGHHAEGLSLPSLRPLSSLHVSSLSVIYTRTGSTSEQMREHVSHRMRGQDGELGETGYMCMMDL